ncbi:MAG: HAMP domain-containing protein, partial [Rhizobium sp.]|nr:HAMP domain-containing protein [Rhizobium sp.]
MTQARRGQTIRSISIMNLLTQIRKTSRSEWAISEIQELTKRLADGDLSHRAHEQNATGEARDLLIAVNALLDVAMRPVGMLHSAIDQMASEHDKGDIDVVLPADRFHGDLATMAKGINDMVAGHIAVKKKAMAVVKEFGEGNFNAPMEQLPGKKAFISDTI